MANTKAPLFVQGVRLPSTPLIEPDPNFPEDLKVFQTRKDDVFIGSYPKSGTTWVREILWQIFHDGATSNVHIGDRVYWFDMHPLLRRRGAEKDESSPSPRPIVELLPSPRLFHSHLPYRLIPKGQDESTVCKYIYIARNPKDVVVSFYLFMQTIPEMPENGMTIDQVIEGFLNGSGPYGLWTDHVLGWWKHKDDANVLYLKYEDVKKDPLSVVKAIAEFVNKPLSEEMIQRIAHQCSFGEMAKNPASYQVFPGIDDARFLRKGEIGDWKNHFTPEINDKFETEIIAKLKEHGLEFEC